MIESYLQHQEERNAQGIPALPLNPEQTKSLCSLLQNPPAGKEDFLMQLFTERISPGVDPAAEVKAEFLGKIIDKKVSSPLVSRVEAVAILGTMKIGR
ncbi:MAG: aconitate hydratase B, partial [Desulfuromonas sp.]|nr:aconitate hydratase B [Desulfuromonas sp.]